MKKITFFVFLCLFITSLYAQNVSDFSVDLNKAGNGVIIRKYKGSVTDVVVPSVIEGYPVTELADECFKDTKITSIKLPNGIIKIGEDCFLNCSSLRNINLPDTLTYLGASAFQDTKSLTSVTIPESVKTFGNDLAEFKDWVGLFNHSGIKKIVFSGSRESISVNIFKGVNDIYTRTFWGDLIKAWESSVEEIVLPKGLKKIDSKTFYTMGKLKILTIPDTVVEIGEYAFYGCLSLPSIVIPSSVIEIGEGAFQSCSNLKTIIIPNTVKKIGDGCFADCENLKSATLPNNIKEISQLLFIRSGLTSIVIPPTVEIIGILAFNDTQLTDITFPSGLKEIQGGAFNNCSKLRNLVFPDSITSINFGTVKINEKTYLAFSNCDSLTISSKAKLRNLGYKE